jgi:hypothetical protein
MPGWRGRARCAKALETDVKSMRTRRHTRSQNSNKKYLLYCISECFAHRGSHRSCRTGLTTQSTSHLRLQECLLLPLSPCSVAPLAPQPRYARCDNHSSRSEVLRRFEAKVFRAALYLSSRRWRTRARRGRMSPGRQDSPLQCVQGSDTARSFAM